VRTNSFSYLGRPAAKSQKLQSFREGGGEDKFLDEKKEHYERSATRDAGGPVKVIFRWRSLQARRPREQGKTCLTCKKKPSGKESQEKGEKIVRSISPRTAGTITGRATLASGMRKN